MKAGKDKIAQESGGNKAVSHPGEGMLREFSNLSGQDILDRISSRDQPEQLIRQMPGEDFFWLIKRVGQDDCLPLLELASEEQWQYLLDLEVWNKDRLDLAQVSDWLGRLQQADPGRLGRWLLGEGQALSYYYLFRSIELEIRDDETSDIRDGFMTQDGVFYVRVRDSRLSEMVQNILKTMAGEDLNKYHSLLLGLGGLVPAEAEESLYRMRGARLAEHGFLPFEEALSVYAPLDPDSLNLEKPSGYDAPIHEDDPDMGLVPVSPLYHAGGGNLLTETTARITDGPFLDRIRLEFAGLCNQVISADGVLLHEIEVLVTACRKTSGYLGLAFERLCGPDLDSIEKLLKNNSLLSIFRVGYGLAQAVKWDAVRWVEQSWFHGLGLDHGFWGDSRGETLAGLLEKRPRFFTGFREGEEYRDFERLSELDHCRDLLYSLAAIDALLERLSELYPMDKGMLQDPTLTFQPLLFDLWARQQLNLEPCFSGISSGQARELFRHLRAGDGSSPFQMHGFREVFMNDLMAYASDLDPEAFTHLRNALSGVWQEFRKEYERVSEKDLDRRFARFIRITAPEPAVQK